MQTKPELQTEVKKPLGTSNKSLQQNTTKDEKNPNVRTTEYKKMEEIFLTDPDSVTREEFLFFQSAVGYRRAIQLLNEGKRRKQLRKMDGTSRTVKKQQQSNKQEKTGATEQKIIQKQKTSQVSQKSENEPIQKKESSSDKSLPGNLRSGLEKLSGIDLSDVSVHKNSEKPQQVGALAYTEGNNIHIAPGQEKHIPHEGWHAVQQKQGRVAPTLQMKTGTLVNDEVGLEKEADIMGSKALQVGSKTDTVQLKKSNNTQQENRVIQRMVLKNIIQTAKYKDENDNVSKIQDILIKLGYWAGAADDKATGYFGDVTKKSLINFQLGFMKLKESDLYYENGDYVGCGPKTAEQLNYVYNILYSGYADGNAIEMIKNKSQEEKTKESYLRSGQIPTGPTAMEAADMADKCYTAKKGDKAFGGWEVIEDPTLNCEGLRLVVYGRMGIDGKQMQYVIANAGTNPKSLNDWKNNLAQPFGDSTDMKDSLIKVRDFVDKHPGKSITFVGHSKGGAEAVANAVATNKNVIIFNPAQVSLKNNGLENEYKNYTGNITSYVVDGEILYNIFGSPIGDVELLPTMYYTGYPKELGFINVKNSIDNHYMSTVKVLIEQREKQRVK